MSEEEKKTEETASAEETGTKGERQSIESIEQTVEDLKKKIQELSEENEKKAEQESDAKLNIPDFKLNKEQKEKIEQDPRLPEAECIQGSGNRQGQDRRYQRESGCEEDAG